MPVFSISSMHDSAPYGEYEGATEANALRAMYDDAGHQWPGDDEAMTHFAVELSVRGTLAALVEASGLSHSEFSARVLGRDPRSLRRYLAGDVIPPTLASWVTKIDRIEVTTLRVTVTLRR